MSGLVSIIIPTYNRENFLPYALDSVKKQTYKNWELIIIDDGSTDNTKKVCMDFAKNAKQKVIYHYQPNQGVAAARNAGLRLARGDYIAFLDSDDRWYPWHLKKILNAFELEPSLDFIFAAGRKIDFFTNKIIVNHNFFDSNGSHPILDIKLLNKKDIFFYIVEDYESCKPLVLKYGLPSGLQCTVFRKTCLIDEFFPADLKIAEDRYLLYKLILTGKKFGFLLSINVLRYSHDKHLSGEKIESPEKMEFIALNLLKCYQSLLQFCNSYYERRIIKDKILEFYLYYLIPSLEKQGKNKEIFKALLNTFSYKPLSFAVYKNFVRFLIKCF